MREYNRKKRDSDLVAPRLQWVWPRRGTPVVARADGCGAVLHKSPQKAGSKKTKCLLNSTNLR